MITMSTVTITISPDNVNDLISKLTSIIQTCSDRMMNGFETQSPHFIYEYHIGEECGHSFHTCSVCDGHSGEMSSGAELAGRYPNLSKLFPFAPNHEDSFYPDMHRDGSFTRYCGCEIYLTNRVEGCVNMLGEELQAVTTI